MDGHKQEWMSKAEAVAHLVALPSRHKDMTTEEVSAIQVASRSLLKRIFDREKNFARRRAKRTADESAPLLMPVGGVTRWGLWIRHPGGTPYLSKIVFETREEAEAHPRNMAEYEERLADEAANGGDANGARAHEQTAREWRATAVKAFPIAVPDYERPDFVSMDDKTTTSEEK